MPVMRLREWRDKRALSLRKLGELSGVHYVSLARMGAGELDPRLSTLRKLCKALNITLGELVGERKPKKGAK